MHHTQTLSMPKIKEEENGCPETIWTYQIRIMSYKALAAFSFSIRNKNQPTTIYCHNFA